MIDKVIEKIKEIDSLLPRWVSPLLVMLTILGLTYFVLSDSVRTIAGASILALIMGGYMIYSGVSRGTPGGLRVLVLVLGLPMTLAAFYGLYWLMTANTVTPAGRAQERITELYEVYDTALDLSGLGLTEVPSEVFELTHLTFLDLSENQLTELPAEIGNLSRLHSLELDYNRLTTLPPEIGQLDELIWLEVYDNRLTHLPPEIGQLSSLERLDLAENNLTTLPPEVGQLTNLEHLYLTGNAIESLPPEIDDLVASTGLNVVDHTDTQSGPVTDFFYRFAVPISLGVLSLLAWGATWLVSRREAAFRTANAGTGEIFAIPPFARGSALFVIIALTIVSSMMLLSAVNGERTDVSWGTALGLPLILAPVFLPAVYFLLHNYGTVVLTDDAVILNKMFRTKRLRYSEIVDIKERGFGLPANLVLKGEKTTLHINRRVSDLPRLYVTIQKRMDRPQGPTEETPHFPYQLRPTRRSNFWGIIVGIIMATFALVIGLGVTWMLKQQTSWISKDLLPILLALVGLGTGLLAIIFVIITVVGWIKPRQPSAFDLSEEAIRFRYPLRAWQSWDAGDLVSVSFDHRQLIVPTSPRLVGGSYGTWSTYVVVLTFTGEREIAIAEDRTRQFGMTPEELGRLFRELYQVE